MVIFYSDSIRSIIYAYLSKECDDSSMILGKNDVVGGGLRAFTSILRGL